MYLYWWRRVVGPLVVSEWNQSPKQLRNRQRFMWPLIHRDGAGSLRTYPSHSLLTQFHVRYLPYLFFGTLKGVQKGHAQEEPTPHSWRRLARSSWRTPPWMNG